MFEIIPDWHPIFVHFTVALFSLAAGLFAVTLFARSPLTGLTGLYAYNTVTRDTLSLAAMTRHRNWAIVTITLILTLAVGSFVRVRCSQALSSVFIAAMLVAGGVLASTAWYGGELVYRHGLGVMSLPKTDDHEHEYGNAAPARDHHEGNDDHHVAEATTTIDEIDSSNTAVESGLAGEATKGAAEQDNGHSHSSDD